MSSIVSMARSEENARSERRSKRVEHARDQNRVLMFSQRQAT